MVLWLKKIEVPAVLAAEQKGKKKGSGLDKFKSNWNY
jgi:hypothetical protein